MRTQDLYAIAETENINIIYGDFPEVESMSVQYAGRCVIGMDNALVGQNAVEHLAHELGHCVRGAFYHPRELKSVRRKMERKADEWMIRKLLPVDVLKAAIFPRCEYWQIAEELGCSERLLRSAVEYYTDTGEFP